MQSLNTGKTTGLLLVGHGTREPAGVAQFLELAERVSSACPELLTEPCFLELAEPTIAEAVSRLAGRGANDLVVAPLLLFAAGHAKEDIPQAVAAAIAGHPEMQCVRQAGHLGCHPAMLELSRLRFDQCLAARPPAPREQTLLLMVGRGSRDEGATAEMLEFARLRGDQSQVGRVDTCFVAIARPSVEEALPRVAESGYRRIVVQPHLLFDGLLLSDLRQSVEQAADEWPSVEWQIAGPLGPHELLAQAVISRAGVGTTRRAAT